MSIANDVLAKIGVRQLNYDSKLESNAAAAAAAAGGTMTHQLNSGTMAQVIAPGTPDMKSFESVFIGGWICEVGQSGVDCPEWTGPWNHEGQTGHADILMNGGYKSMGCHCGDDMWFCDLA